MSEWTDLEQLLKNSRSEPSVALRRRVLAATQLELSRRPALSGWRLLVAAAAVLVLWLHVSWSAVLDTRLDVSRDRSSEARRLSRQIQQLVPDMPLAESQRLAWITLASADQPLFSPFSAREHRRGRRAGGNRR
jgi:hypothetical protein